MITLFGSLIGFIGAAFPEFLKLWRDRADRAHELQILQLQIEQQKQGAQGRLEEIRAGADSAESVALYNTWRAGIGWVDALNGTVRPMIAYGFFLLYVLVKLNQMSHMPWLLWTEEDQAIFAGIISFYFGARAMGKMRK